jgi:hypothetical protein
MVVIFINGVHEASISVIIFLIVHQGYITCNIQAAFTVSAKLEHLGSIAKASTAT